jgi:hypothetical protein
VPPAGVMVERSRSVVSGKAGMEVESRRWEDS